MSTAAVAEPSALTLPVVAVKLNYKVQVKTVHLELVKLL